MSDRPDGGTPDGGQGGGADGGRCWRWSAGENQLDERRLAGAAGATGRARRVDADRVRAVTGFAIGGVPPFGHTDAACACFVDRDLLRHDVVWAAAGTPARRVRRRAAGPRPGLGRRGGGAAPGLSRSPDSAVARRTAARRRPGFRGHPTTIAAMSRPVAGRCVRAGRRGRQRRRPRAPRAPPPTPRPRRRRPPPGSRRSRRSSWPACAAG